MQTTSIESVWVNLDKLVFPEETRTHSAQDLDSLIKDMNDNGQLQEIVVAPKDDQYEVLSGVGRVLAARKMCWDKMRAYVRTGLSEFEKLRITFSENEKQGNPPAVFQAKLLRKMLETEQLNQASLAERVGKSAVLINQYMALMDLDQEVENTFGILKLYQAMEILRLPDRLDQIAVAKRCVEKDLSRQELQTIIAWKMAGAARKSPKPAGVTAHQPPHQPFAEAAPTSHAETLSSRNHFAWRGSKLEIYPRPFVPFKEELTAFISQLRSDMVLFMTQHPASATEIEGGDFSAKLQIVPDAIERTVETK